MPAAFTKITGEAHWEILLRARAIETQCYVRDYFTSCKATDVEALSESLS